MIIYNYLFIQLFIFLYHFSQEENINKIIQTYFIWSIEFLPTIDYDGNEKYIVIK